MSLSTLRARRPPPLASLASLTDDSLLLILHFLSVPQLLTLLSLSRRLNHLIVQYTLSHNRAILMQVTCTWVPSCGPYLKPKFAQSFFFSRRFHRHTDIHPSQSFDRLPVKALRSEQLHQTLSSSLPLHLPRLLPRLQSLTFAYFLDDVPLRREASGNGPFNDQSEWSNLRERLLSCEPLHKEPVCNGPLIGYLKSNWRQSLVSLELHLLNEYPGERPASNQILFDGLNQLSALRHLSLLFSVQYSSPERIIPDSMPVLGQLTSFALYKYPSGNLPALLRQLGPNLTSLSLYIVTCSEEDFLSFLRSKPAYRQTLRTLEIHLKYTNDWFSNTTPPLSALANCALPLERLLSSHSLVAGDLFSCFNVLSRDFSRLQELGYLTLTITELRALREDHSRISLPRLTSLRRVYLYIIAHNCSPAFQPSELLDSHLSLLGTVFCAVQYIEIQFVHKEPMQLGDSHRALLAEQLVVKMKAHFQSARTCKGVIHPGGGHYTALSRHWNQEIAKCPFGQSNLADVHPEFNKVFFGNQPVVSVDSGLSRINAILRLYEDVKRLDGLFASSLAVNGALQVSLMIISRSMSLSTLRARLPPQESLTSLTDDSLLLILGFFSVPQLLTFLSLSRRLNYLIVQYILPKYRAILMQVTCTWVPNRGTSLKPKFDQSFFFSRGFHRHTDIFFSPNVDRLSVKALGSRKVHQKMFKSKSCSLPLHLPYLLPHLRSLTFAYFLDDVPLGREALGYWPMDAELESTWRQSLVSCQPLHIEPVYNGPLIGYLQSTWRQSLVSLELHLLNEYVGERPSSNSILFDQLDQLSALRHLSLLFSVQYFLPLERLLPDSMPVLGQLDSFALYRYRAYNLPLLLAQLGPNLTSLSLYLVTCSEEDFFSFLRSKPTYRQTLRTLEIHLTTKNDPLSATTPRLSTLANYGLPLERFLNSNSLVAGNLFSCFKVLSRNFSRLQELGYLTLTITELRALRDGHSRITLPRLTSLRRVYLYILAHNCSPAFHPDELLDSHLSLLGTVFCAAEYIEIQFVHKDIFRSESRQLSDSDWARLAEQLPVQMARHFASARSCKSGIYPRRGGEKAPSLWEKHWNQI